MKYRTKPFEIEAVQWKGYNVSEIKNFVGKTENGEDGFLLPDEITGVWDDPHVWDYLQKVWVPVNLKDYVIRGMKREYYPCEQEVFEAKYEPMYNTGGVIKNPVQFVSDNGFVIPRKKLTDDNEE